MALEIAKDTPFGVDATYHRIQAIHFYMEEGAGEIVMASYIDASKRAAGKVAGIFKIPLQPGVIRNPDTDLARAELYKIIKRVMPEMRNAIDV